MSVSIVAPEKFVKARRKLLAAEATSARRRSCA
jgi:hypothetical protein